MKSMPYPPYAPVPPTNITSKSFALNENESVQSFLECLTKYNITDYANATFEVRSDCGDCIIFVHYDQLDSPEQFEQKMQEYNKDLEYYKVKHAKYLEAMKLWFEEQTNVKA